MKNSYLKNALEKGAWITSSGTTGIPKKIFRTSWNIKKCNEVALKAQNITPTSSIYTVTRMTHAGGLLAQTLPAVSIGARIQVEEFNPFRFLKEFKKHTHTFLPPEYMLAVSKMKNFASYDFEKKYILTGSSPVSFNVIAKFVERNAVVQPNWGMSEVGPLTIYSTIQSLTFLEELKSKRPENSYLMGDKIEIDYKVEEGELWVRGDLCVYDTWFATGDLVEIVDGVMFFRGRKG